MAIILIAAGLVEWMQLPSQHGGDHLDAGGVAGGVQLQQEQREADLEVAVEESPAGDVDLGVVVSPPLTRLVYVPGHAH